MSHTPPGLTSAARCVASTTSGSTRCTALDEPNDVELLFVLEFALELPDRPDSPEPSPDPDPDPGPEPEPEPEPKPEPEPEPEPKLGCVPDATGCDLGADSADSEEMAEEETSRSPMSLCATAGRAQSYRLEAELGRGRCGGSFLSLGLMLLRALLDAVRELAFELEAGVDESEMECKDELGSL